MTDAPGSLDSKQLNRTLIGSVLFIDIVDYSKRTVPDQLEMKEAFIELLTEAIQNVAASDRIMVDTGDGAGIAFLGDPEDALFTALSLRDAINAGVVKVGEPGFVRMGINLGPLKVVRDINGHTNMIGDAANDAQRVMSFAEPGQVMVSHSYYDIISRFSRDYSKLFVHEGMRADKHVREHEVYRFGPVEDTEDLAEKLRDRSRLRANSGFGPSSYTHPPEIPAPSVFRPAPSVPVTPKVERKAKPVPNAPKKVIPRAALIATLIAATTVVGAVWSWTSIPDSKPEGVPASASVSAPAPDVPAEAVSSAGAVASPRPVTATSSAKAVSVIPAVAAVASANANADTIKPGDTKNTETPVDPNAKPGTVKLAIQPWGEVYVDGSKRGVSPPLSSLTLPPGKHRIEIRNGEFAPLKKTIDVKSATETKMTYVF